MISPAVELVTHGTKVITFKNLSTLVKIVSGPSYVFHNSVTKSTVTSQMDVS